MEGRIHMLSKSRRFKKILALLLAITSIGEITQNQVKSMKFEDQGLETEKSVSNESTQNDSKSKTKKIFMKNKDTEEFASRGTQQDWQSKIQKYIEENPRESSIIAILTLIGMYKIGTTFTNNSEDLVDKFEKDECDDLNDKSKEIADIIKDLRNKAQKICDASYGKNKDFGNTWEGLKYLLGEDATKFVETNYPEWKERLTKERQSDWKGKGSGHERFALMSMAYSLRLAAIENYDHSNAENNALLFGQDLPKVNLKNCKNDAKLREERLKKVIVEDNDILRSAHGFISKHPKLANYIGVLNAGDPYEPNGFLPNWGSVLEEYLSMTTTLVRDLSGREFRKGLGNQEFYTTRKEFPPICGSSEKVMPSEKVIMQRLAGSGRDFYHERGIMSRNVYLIRDLGNIHNNYQKDPVFPFQNPDKYLTKFNPPKNGIGSVKFRILSIAGLEDRSKKILDTYGKGTQIYRTWKEITKKQCEFVLKAFIGERNQSGKRSVKVLFLCAFGAGAFGGKASMVAECWKELLIDEGYIDHFDYVLFPIGYDKEKKEIFEKQFT